MGVYIRFNNVVFSLVRLNAAYMQMYNNNIYCSPYINTCATFPARMYGIIGGLHSLVHTGNIIVYHVWRVCSVYALTESHRTLLLRHRNNPS